MTGQEGGKIAKSCIPRSWFHSPKRRNGTNPVVYVKRKCSSSIVLFFLVVVAILSSVKKPPRSRWNQSAFLSFRSSVGKSLRKDKEQEREGGGGNRTAGEDDSALFLHGCFSFVLLFTPLCLPYLTFSVLPHPRSHQNWEKEASSLLPFFSSIFPLPDLLTRKKNLKESWNDH